MHVGLLQASTVGHLLVLELAVSFIRVFSPINVPYLFFRKDLTQACIFITFALSQLLIKYLSSRANLIAAEQICMTPQH